MTAAAKFHIRIFINEGTDVTNATQMKDAVLSHEGVKSVQMVWNQHMLLGWLVTCESPWLSWLLQVKKLLKKELSPFHSKKENMITTFNKLEVSVNFSDKYDNLQTQIKLSNKKFNSRK